MFLVIDDSDIKTRMSVILEQKKNGTRPRELFNILQNRVKEIYNYDDIIGEHYKIKLYNDYFIEIIGNVEKEKFIIDLFYHSDGKLLHLIHEEYIILEYFLTDIFHAIGYNIDQLNKVKDVISIGRINDLISIRKQMMSNIIQLQKSILEIDKQLNNLI